MGAVAARARAEGGPLDGLERNWPNAPFVYLDGNGRRTAGAPYLYVNEAGRWVYGEGRWAVCGGCGCLHAAPIFEGRCALCGTNL